MLKDTKCNRKLINITTLVQYCSNFLMHVAKEVHIREVTITSWRPVFTKKVLKIYSYMFYVLCKEEKHTLQTLKTISSLSLCLMIVSFSVLDLPLWIFCNSSATLLQICINLKDLFETALYNVILEDVRSIPPALTIFNSGINRIQLTTTY